MLIDIIYEPVSKETDDIFCYFSKETHLVYRSYISRKGRNGEQKINHPTVRQCYYCQDFFAKSEENVEKHMKVRASQEGVLYTLENNKLVSFRDNFKLLLDVPFTVYFDFETTTGDATYSDPKMFVINMDKIVIFRSFQQNHEEIYDLSHFRWEHVPFFDYC